MHCILHQKQECCQRVSQSIYNHVLHDSIGIKAFYIQMNFNLPDIQHPAAPVIFHDFLLFFDSLLCSPSNSSVLVLFSPSYHSPPPPPKKLLHPQPSLTNSLLLTVASSSDQQQGRLTHSEFLDLPLIYSTHFRFCEL